MSLKLSKDRKVTPKTKNSTPEIPNAFGLPAHLSCPGKTSVCENNCYAFKLERAYTNVQKLLKHNYETLIAPNADMLKLLSDMITVYKNEHNRVERLRQANYDKIFRIHWDGDFFSEQYAQAWRNVILFNDDVQFWAHTRSFTDACNVVPILAGIPNLALYLSIDTDNVEQAGKIIREYPTVNVAYLDETFEQALLGFGDTFGRKAPKCPEQTGRYPLVDNETEQGACAKCMLCVNGTNNVLFSLTKK